MKTRQFHLDPEDNSRLYNLCGQLDENIMLIERHLAVEISHRSYDFKVFGPDEAVELAEQFILNLYHDNDNLTSKEIDSLLQSSVNKLKRAQSEESVDNNLAIKTSKLVVRPRAANQQRYIKRIHSHDINFGIGPAGTGKTFLAVACAVEALESGKVSRIILVRPAVEAGENLGFLPGGLSEKVDPYLRPMYDALYELMGAEKVVKLIERNVIEIAPLAFMRGRTLNDAFIILDESQNTTKEQMKMFLTRIGFNSTAVITGDITQVDLPRGKMSGLRHIIDILTETNGLSFTFFDTYDVVRHPLVQAVVEAYQRYEAIHGT